MNKKNYGLFTAITMITGVVIGSGIFFKSDDILSYTDGNMFLGVLVFIIAAMAIIFGCLTISQLATRTDKPGGIVAYAQDFVNLKVASAFGWFQTFLYLPALVAVIAWVAGLYICQLFNLPQSIGMYSLIGFACTVVLYLLNIISAKLGGMFQNASMLIKLVPLLLVAIAGFIFGNPGTIVKNDIEMIRNTSIGTAWFAAFAPIAFSFDGWIVATSISHEIKNSKRNLPLALICAPIVILIAYIAYFLGVSSLVGPDEVMRLGDASVYAAFRELIGPIGSKALLVFIVISVLGTLNGLVIAQIRMPYSLAIRDMIFANGILKKESKTFGGMPINSAIFGFVISLVWSLVHYWTMNAGMRGDISEISICVSYLNYCILYVVVMRMTKRGEIKSKFMGYVVPVLAIMGSCVILLGSITNPYFPIYVLICLLTMTVGFVYGRKAKEIQY